MIIGFSLNVFTEFCDKKIFVLLLPSAIVVAERLFLQAPVILSRGLGACMAGGMHCRGCVWQDGMHGRGVCVAGGGMRGRWGGMRGRWGLCMAGGMRDRGACMAGERPLQRTVRILVECILVRTCNLLGMRPSR